MPLSEREQQILAEIEKNLRSEDAKFARGSRGSSDRGTRDLKLGIGVLLAGVASLIAFFFTGHLLWGVLAFVGMVGGIVLIAGAFKTPMEARARGEGRRKRLEDVLSDWEDRIRRRYKRSE